MTTLQPGAFGPVRWLLVRVVSATLSIAACSDNQGAMTPMQFNFRSYATAAEAKLAISAALPIGVSRRAVEEWLASSGIACFAGSARDPYIACRYIEPSGTMVHPVWSLGFFFTERRELERIEVNRGLVGP